MNLPPSSDARHYRRAGGVTRSLADALGRTPGGVHQALDGPVGAFAQVERMLEIAVATGHGAWAAQRLERLTRIVRSPRVELCVELQERAQAADLAEDAAEHRYCLRPSVQTLDQWIRHLERDVLQNMALLDAARLKRARLMGAR